MGHKDNAITEQNMTNPARDRAKYGDESETMKALAWMGKNHVEVSQSTPTPPLECSLNSNCDQSTLPSPKSSKLAMSSSRSPVRPFAAPISISYTVPLFSYKKVTS